MAFLFIHIWMAIKSINFLYSGIDHYNRPGFTGSGFAPEFSAYPAGSMHSEKF